MIVHFGSWSDDIHTTEEQKTRLESASKAKTTPDFVDLVNETAYYEGRGKNPYIATLDKCTCGDFIHRHLPCKHIYRLAMQLNLLDYEYIDGRNKNNILKYVSLLSSEAKVLLRSIFLNNGCIITTSKCANELIINGFCYEIIHKDKKSQKVEHLSLMPDVEEIAPALMKKLREEIRKDENNGNADDT